MMCCAVQSTEGSKSAQMTLCNYHFIYHYYVRGFYLFLVISQKGAFSNLQYDFLLEAVLDIKQTTNMCFLMLQQYDAELVSPC